MAHVSVLHVHKSMSQLVDNIYVIYYMITDVDYLLNLWFVISLVKLDA